MALAIYKPGQGYWTRTMSAVGAGTIVLTGVAWLWDQLAVIRNQTQYWQGGMAIAMIVGFGLLIYWLIGRKKNIVDFMIATEGEMKKVNWPSKKEIIGSTWVVIAGTLMIAVLLFVIDIGFGAFFQFIDVLETPSP